MAGTKDDEEDTGCGSGVCLLPTHKTSVHHRHHRGWYWKVIFRKGTVWNRDI